MRNERLLRGIVLKVICILITFFSLNLNIQAASFAYKDFDWNEFYEENKSYWSSYCASGNMDEEECEEILLSGKKEFYTRMYKLLAKYEKKGYKLDDNIILATAFYGLTPDTFTDIPEEYKKHYRDGSAYNLDVNFDINSYDIDYDEDATYYENETDTLKTLTKHMFSYNASCQGKVADPELDEDGNNVCYQGTLKDDECIGEIKSYKLNYSEHLISKYKILKLFGIKTEKKTECEEELGGTLETSNEKQIDYEMYWEFLEKSNYFDNKIHLTSKYASVLEKTNHKYMKQLTEDEREKYSEDILEIRKIIVKIVKSIYESFNKYATITPDSYNKAGCTSGSAWWPIGSDVITEEDSILFAKGDPVTKIITSPFGKRVHPIKGTVSQHTGIDIGGVTEGVTNVIAVKDGVVIYPTEGAPTNCPSSYSLDSCGGGYGNYVIIQHNDGTYSLYAHLYTNSITVRANDSVKQGQIIGKAGTSGNSTGPHLHFEIRQGTNSSSQTVDPTTVISAENPRADGGICSGSSTEMSKMLHWFEGACNAKTNGSNYVVVDDSYGYPTAGYGVALEYNIERFKKYGIDVTNMTFGDEIPIEIVDAVEIDFKSQKRPVVLEQLASASISLTETQIDALLMIVYQFGNIGNFTTTYKEYGNTDALKQNTYSYGNKQWYYFRQNPSTGNGRAEATWKLFHEGIYTYGDNC